MWLIFSKFLTKGTHSLLIMAKYRVSCMRWNCDWCSTSVTLVLYAMSWYIGPCYNCTQFWWLNTLRPRQNGRHFADAIFKLIFLNENVWIPIKISLKFIPQGPINNIPALVQIMTWRRPGDEPLSGPMMVRLPTHICVTRPQWVKARWWYLQCVGNGDYACSLALSHPFVFKSMKPEHNNSQHVAEAIFMRIFCEKKNIVYWFKFHWSLLLRVELSLSYD